MITYSPLWITMKRKKITSYQLIYKYHFSSNTIRRMKRNENITLKTLNDLCIVLNCRVEEVIQFIPEETTNGV